MKAVTHDIKIIALLAATFFLCGFDFAAKLKNEQGNKYYQKGQIGKAKTAYQGALKENPKSPEIAYNLGNAYYKESSFKESQGNYKQAAQNEKNLSLQSKAFYNLGNALYRQKDLEKAAEFYKQALRLNPKDEDAKYNLEILLKKKPDTSNQKPEEQKDKQDQQKQQDKQKQEGSQGEQGSQDEQLEKQEGGGQSQEQKADDKDEKSEKEQAQGKQEQQKENKPQETQSMSEEEKKEQEEKEKRAAVAQQAQQQEDEKGEEPRKSEADTRAEQILNALENQEQQVLKFRSGVNNPQPRIRRVSEKDW